MAKLFSKTDKTATKQAEKPVKKAEPAKKEVTKTVTEEPQAIPVAKVPNNVPSDDTGGTILTKPNNWHQKSLRFRAQFPQAGDINFNGPLEEVLTRIQVKLGKTRAEVEKIIESL